MSLMQSILLGLIQGITEFLPVSSSAHLKIAKHFLGMEEASSSVLLDLSCHLGTLFALILFLRKDVIQILQSKQKIALFFCALLPLIPCYFFLKPLRDLASQKAYLGPCMISTGLILLAGQIFRMPRSKSREVLPNMKDVIMIGTLQSAALIPGISRSAATISCARVLGWDAKQAVRFSFLLSIPTILGGNLIEFAKAPFQEGITLPLSTLFAAFTTSFFVGFFLVKKAVTYLEKGNLKPFAWYCLTIGCFVTFYFTL